MITKTKKTEMSKLTKFVILPLAIAISPFFIVPTAFANVTFSCKGVDSKQLPVRAEVHPINRQGPANALVVLTRSSSDEDTQTFPAQQTTDQGLVSFSNDTPRGEVTRVDHVTLDSTANHGLTLTLEVDIRYATPATAQGSLWIGETGETINVTCDVPTQR